MATIAIRETPLLRFLLRRADDSLILGHRLSEWCGHAPAMEEDMALANIALDLIGQARTLYSYAAEVEGGGHTEDDFAYLRDERAYQNLLLVEQPNGDYAETIARQLFHAAFMDPYWRASVSSRDATLAARLTFADSLLHLDPTARGIEDEERYERARQLVERTLVVIEPCVEQGPAALTDSARALLADSTASVEDADADHLTTVANNLWTTYASTCRAYEGDSVLHFLHARLSQ